MKKIYGFLGAAALLMTVACSKDGGEGAPAPDVKGDFYMTMTISQTSSSGARTETESQGKEFGQAKENEIKKGLLIVTEEDNKIISVAEIASADIIGAAPTYAASFEMARAELSNSMGAAQSKSYRLFLIANHKAEMKTLFEGGKGKKLQEMTDATFSLSSDGDTYWGSDGFLMTNSEMSSTTIYAAELAAGKHTTKTDALNLGEVKVQRAMSRIDFATGNTVFTTSDDQSYLKDITITFEGVALVNMAQVANLFKAVGDDKTQYSETTARTPKTWSFFRQELKTTTQPELDGNYVFSPEQSDWNLSLFQTGEQKDLSTLAYDDISDITDADDSNYTPPTGTTGSEPDYYIWRYCMENTNYDKTNQKNGNSTGVVFKAKLTGSKFTGTDPVYAYGNFVIGTASDLKNYVAGTSNDDLHDMIVSKFNEAAAKYKEAESSEYTNVSDLDAYLPTQGFAIYRPTSGNFYCYYIYWNRHNDNGNNALMDVMEFATVRNNVYKLKVSSVSKLGHPADPDDDPDPTHPDDPDEKDSFWGEVTCKVLDWEVRINDIEF